MNYERDIRIDESALDVEWLEQATLAMKYGRNWADCNRKVIQCEEKLKVIKSELIRRANKDPEGCCNKKSPNAQDLEAYYRNHPRHKAAKEEWIEAAYERDMAEIAKNEISFTRKAALENLSKLFLGNYFAGPKMGRNLTEERESRQRSIDSGIGKKLKKGRAE